MLTTSANSQRFPILDMTIGEACQKGGAFARKALPVASAIGYTAAITAVFIRAFHGEDKISPTAVQSCIASALAPTLIAVGATGLKAARHAFVGNCKAVKRIFREALRPGGFISDVVFPKKEFEVLGRAAFEMEAAAALAANR